MRVGLLWLFTCVAANEFFSSMAHMTNLLKTESDQIENLNMYIKTIEASITNLREKLSDINKEIGSQLALDEDAAYYLSYPLNQFHLIRRFHYNWREIKNILKGIASHEIPNIVEIEDSELVGAAEALTRLSDVYHVPIGEFTTPAQMSGLSQEDLFIAGRLLHYSKKYYGCARFMRAALLKNGNVDLDVMEDYASFCYSQVNNYRNAYYLSDEIIQRGTYADLDRIKRNVEYYKSINVSPSNNRHIERTEHWYPEERDRYESLCRGEGVTPALHCYYYHGKPDNYYLQLGPVKTEVLFNSPYVVRFIDVYSDYEMNHLKEVAFDFLNRATVFDPSTHKLVNADYRVSHSAWLKDHDDEIVRRINARMGAITGLDLESAEEMQMSNYGMGGQYEPHYDFSRRENDIYNNRRIATWLGYLTDVAEGGGTVFLNAKLRVLPIRGTAVFWWNLYRNGEGDMRTRHAACPVLVGTKWVSNKWFHEFGNEFNRQCSTDQLYDNSHL